MIAPAALCCPARGREYTLKRGILQYHATRESGSPEPRHRSRVPLKLLARPEGFEPPALGSEVRCSNPLSYGRARQLTTANAATKATSTTTTTSTAKALRPKPTLAAVSSRSPTFAVVLGWAMGFEPTTTGATVRCSAIELRPPYGGCWRLEAAKARRSL